MRGKGASGKAFVDLNAMTRRGFMPLLAKQFEFCRRTQKPFVRSLCGSLAFHFSATLTMMLLESGRRGRGSGGVGFEFTLLSEQLRFQGVELGLILFPSGSLFRCQITALDFG
mmetsp:Transcript_2166/g.6742  ORF Transcript_2166/g.6742 Transcript_2166/m.6742 type:complete len:113 (+) Transcript_2166:304-642(+)